jgi:hypothetical protein
MIFKKNIFNIFFIFNLPLNLNFNQVNLIILNHNHHPYFIHNLHLIININLKSPN